MYVHTQRFTEFAELLGTIYASGAPTEQNTGRMKISGHHRQVVIIHPVSLGGNALDVDCEQGVTATSTLKALDSGGKDAAILGTDTKPTVIEMRSAEFDVNGGYEYLNVEVTPAGAATFVVEVWGIGPRYSPVATTLLDSVVD